MISNSENVAIREAATLNTTGPSFIVPCYNEAGNVEALLNAFHDVFDGVCDQWHLIMVDDGSTDATLEHITSLCADNNVEVIGFSRNFGKEAAILAGLNAALAHGSEIIGIIDADLQQPPAVALSMYQHLLEDAQTDIVVAYQDSRKESWAMSRIKGAFYRVFSTTSQRDTIADASDFRVFRRSVAEALVSMPEHYRFSKGLFPWVGFSVHAMPYTVAERHSGVSKWTFHKLLAYALEGIVSFSTTPLLLPLGMGAVVGLASIVYLIVLAIRSLSSNVGFGPWALAIFLLVSSLVLVALGIIGAYLSHVFVESVSRPHYIVKTHVLPQNRTVERENVS